MFRRLSPHHHKAFPTTHPILASFSRPFSSSMYPTSSPTGRPRYRIFGSEASLTIEIIPPTFKIVGAGDGFLTVDKLGRFLFTFHPRSLPDKRFDYNSPHHFALSGEEGGLALSQLPARSVRLERSQGFEAVAIERKVLEMSPSDGESVKISVRTEDINTGASLTDLSIQAEAGEWMVLQEIIRSSIPDVVGWAALCSKQRGESIMGAARENVDGYGGYNNDTSMQQQKPSGEDVPF